MTVFKTEEIRFPGENDFDHEPFSREDLDAIEKEMKKIIKKGAKIERFTKSREDAIAYFKEKNEP